MNKLISGIVAIGIYLGLIFLILLYYNVHDKKAKNYVEKNSNRITVTLVNSDKTVFNKSSKVTIPNKPIPKPKATIPTPLPKKVIKKSPPKVKERPKKLATPTKKEIKAKQLEARKKLEEEKIARAKARRDKKRLERLAVQKEEEKRRLAQLAKEKERKRIEERKKAEEQKRAEEIKKEKDKKRLAQIKADKEQEQRRAKERKKEEERKKAEQIKKEKEKKRLARIKAEEERKKRAKERSKNLFASVNTDRPKKQPKTDTQPSRVRHSSAVTDRIRDTHQSGRVSNRNREKGVENAYIAKVEKQLRNWNAQSNYKGQSATIRLTIMSSGHFRYTIKRSSSTSLSSGLRDFMEQLNRIGLGRHDKSSPYVINVTFRAR